MYNIFNHCKYFSVPDLRILGLELFVWSLESGESQITLKQYSKFSFKSQM